MLGWDTERPAVIAIDRWRSGSQSKACILVTFRASITTGPLNTMKDKILKKLRETRHMHAAKAILETPPLVPFSDQVVIFSMIGTRVVLPYLVAAKSLHVQLGKGRIVLLDDGTLTPADRAVLARHLGNPKIHDLRAVATGNCPKGGCWERLLALLDIASDDYVIQLDSDTVTVGDVPEIREAIASNRSFTLLGEPDAEGVGLLSLPDFTRKYHGAAVSQLIHVQHAIERQWVEFPDAGDKYYVRGCAGFSGFSRAGRADRGAAEALSLFAQKTVGPAKWSEWGSEQVASNFLIANSGNPMLLPYARYQNYWNDTPPSDVRFLHFIGTHRYSTNEYRQRTCDVIDALRNR
jgi:hypothetical protein